MSTVERLVRPGRRLEHAGSGLVQRSGSPRASPHRASRRTRRGRRSSRSAAGPSPARRRRTGGRGRPAPRARPTRPAPRRGWRTRASCRRRPSARRPRSSGPGRRAGRPWPACAAQRPSRAQRAARLETRSRSAGEGGSPSATGNATTSSAPASRARRERPFTDPACRRRTARSGYSVETPSVKPSAAAELAPDATSTASTSSAPTSCQALFEALDHVEQLHARGGRDDRLDGVAIRLRVDDDDDSDRGRHQRLLTWTLMSAFSGLPLTEPVAEASFPCRARANRRPQDRATPCRRRRLRRSSAPRGREPGS